MKLDVLKSFFDDLIARGRTSFPASEVVEHAGEYASAVAAALEGETDDRDAIIRTVNLLCGSDDDVDHVLTMMAVHLPVSPVRRLESVVLKSRMTEMADGMKDYLDESGQSGTYDTWKRGGSQPTET